MNAHDAESRPEQPADRFSDWAGGNSAVWYFVGATFLFAGAGSAFTSQAHVLGFVLFGVGIVVVAFGGWVFGREIRGRREKVARGRTEPTEPPAPRI